jgi:deoxyribose-phosphate aldolase
MVRRLPPIDRVGVDRRAAQLATRSVKAEAQSDAIRRAVSMIDLTTLEGQDTPGKIRQLAARAVSPAPVHLEVPSCAALCVYPARVADARDALAGTGVKVASVSTGFPAGQTSLELRLQETSEARASGAEEIDMVISREAYLCGDDRRVIREVEQVKEACDGAHLKVIVEAAELGGYDHLRHATDLVMQGGADVVKTSTGKVGAGATPGVVLVMLEAVRDFADRHGRVVGVKAAGGVRTSKQALTLLVLVKETLGEEWLTPSRFRIGASSLLNDLLMQYEHGLTGHYARLDDFPLE